MCEGTFNNTNKNTQQQQTENCFLFTKKIDLKELAKARNCCFLDHYAIGILQNLSHWDQIV